MVKVSGPGERSSRFGNRGGENPGIGGPDPEDLHCRSSGVLVQNRDGVMWIESDARRTLRSSKS